jgi:hypothetical protein
MLDTLTKLSLEGLVELKIKLRPRVVAEIERRFDLADFAAELEQEDVADEFSAFLRAIDELDGGKEL